MQDIDDHSVLIRYMVLTDQIGMLQAAREKVLDEIKGRLAEKQALGLADELIRCETEYGKGFYNQAVLKGLWTSEAVPHAALNEAWTKAVRAGDLPPDKIIEFGRFNVTTLKRIIRRYGGEAQDILNRAFQRGKPKLVIEWRVADVCQTCGGDVLAKDAAMAGGLCERCRDAALEAQRAQLEADEYSTADAELAREEDAAAITGAGEEAPF